jgi:hypothetical protein
MAHLSDPLFDSLLAVSASWTHNEDHFAFLPMAWDHAESLLTAIAQQAKRIFDKSLMDTRARLVTPSARAALAMFESDPSLSYESRVVRRLLVLRIEKRWEGYQAALTRAAHRLDLTEEDVHRLIVESIDILHETMPFERDLRRAARDKFLAIAAADRAAETQKQAQDVGALTAITLALRGQSNE